MRTPLTPATTVRPGRGGDGLLAVLVGAAALALYVRTLLPGLGGTEDSAKFQYLGAVLGTAHSPGYPLYILISHLFSYLPVGSLAYRINLMSAVFGSLAVMLVFSIVRQLGGRRLVAVAVALALGCGRSFWYNSLVAEVYTLAAALLAALVLALLAWGESRRNRDLFLAVAVFGLALGNHLTILAAVPALVLYAAVTDARRAFRPGVLATVAGIVLLGLAQYLFIVVRTWQGAPALESRAANLSELVAVMTARRFSDKMFVFDLHTLIGERLPAVGGLFAEELGWVGLVLLAVGVPLAFWRHPRAALLLVVSGLGNIALVLNVVGDLRGFLLPAFVLTWALVAVGLEAVVEGVERRGRLRAGGVAVVVLLLPVTLAARNLRVNDLHNEVFETQYFRALFEQIAPRTAFVEENYPVDQRLWYMRYGERAAAGKAVAIVNRDPVRIRALLDDAFVVYAFAEGRDELVGRRLRLSEAEILIGPPAEVLRQVTRGHIVLLAGRGPALPPDSARALGVDDPPARGRPATHYALVGVKGATGGALYEAADGPVAIGALGGDPIGWTATLTAVDLQAAATETGGTIRVGGREVVQAVSGLALAVVSPRGELIATHVFDEARGFRAPFDMSHLPLFEVTPLDSCTDVGDGRWADVTAEAANGALTAHLDDRAPFDARFTLWLGAELPLRPRLALAFGFGSPTVHVEEFGAPSPSAADDLVGRMRDDGLDLEGLPSRPAHLYRVVVDVNDEGQYSTTELDYGGAPTWALARARVDLQNAGRATVCEAGPDPFFGARQREAIPFNQDGDFFFGVGWHGRERDGAIPFRWTSTPEARLIVPVAKVGMIQVDVEASPLVASGAAAQSIALGVNGQVHSGYRMAPGLARYTWTVPAAAWKPGANAVSILVSPVQRPADSGTGPDERMLGAAVRYVGLRLGDTRPR